MIIQGQVGQTIASDGAGVNLRQGRTGEVIMTQAHGRWHEQTARGGVFTMTLTATTTAIAAGHIINASAAANAQFVLWNPVGSGVNLSLLKFYVGIISGTPVGGPVFHALLTQGVPTLANSVVASNVGVVNNNLAGGRMPVARYLMSQAGSALTGAGAAVTLRATGIDFSAAAFAAAAGQAQGLDLVEGDIVIPPGYGWLPMWGGAGTSLLNAYSVTWEEVAI